MYITLRIVYKTDQPQRNNKNILAGISEAKTAYYLINRKPISKAINHNNDSCSQTLSVTSS